MASSYLTLDQFKARTVLPDSYVDSVETRASGFTLAQIAQVSSLDLDGRLRKRYAAPFQAPVPEAILVWVTRIVSFRVLTRYGWDPQDPTCSLVQQDLNDALAQIKEAADAVDGLWDLPLRDDTTASGIVAPATRAYSEQGPYVGLSKQAALGREEDANGDGTYL